jgi:(p)ppGpp synthase/HD superfamily hydrolase
MIQESEQYSKSRHENKFTELEQALKQSSEVELLKLREAYDFAKKIYGDKLKESGETQIFHCL